MKRILNFAGLIFIVLGAVFTVKQHIMTTRSLMANGLVFGMQRIIEDDKEDLALRDIGKALFEAGSPGVDLSSVVGCQKDRECFATIVFMPPSGELVTRQFSCSGPAKFLEWGFPYLAKCYEEYGSSPYFWGRLGIVFDGENPKRSYYDSMFSILRIPILCFGAALLFFSLGMILYRSRSA